MEAIVSRILSQLGTPDLLEKLRDLPQSDLNSLLLALFDARTADIQPQTLLKQYAQNRFVRPAALRPADYHAFAAEILRIAEGEGFAALQLSPSAPLGSCSAMAAVDQKKILSSVRGTETLADPSNMLALHIADGIKEKTFSREKALHFCCESRVSRAQHFSGARFFTHFGLFCYASAALDNRGSCLCESDLLVAHISLLQNLLAQVAQAEIFVKISPRGGHYNGARLVEIAQETLAAQNLCVEILPGDAENRYYIGLNYKVYADLPDGPLEVGDGGFVDWTQRLLGNKKERMLIGGMGMERLLDIAQRGGK